MAFGSEQWMYNAGGFYPHEIDNSARLDTNSYFQRTPSSSGSRTTWTWNAWVKLGSIGQTEVLFTARTAGQSASGQVYFEAGKLAWDEYSGSSNTLRRHTTQVFRDPSAWYMITIVADTTNATASNRGRVYINGTQVTEFSTNVNPSQNQVLETNQNITHRLGANTNNVQYFNGYMAEVNFIDGQALDASNFGETKSGVWIPKEYAGTYGTNGFYLDFATRATDPIDASGNGNNWGSVNVVSTDWMLDSPTNNFCTSNPLSGKQFNNNLITYSEGNLKGVNPAAVSTNGVSTFGIPSTGKYYFEFLAGTRTADMWIGAQSENGFTGNGTGYRHDGGISFNGSSAVAGAYATFTTGDIIGVALDMSGNTATYYKNGTQVATGTRGVATKTYTVWTQLNNTGDSFSLNFGQDSSFAGNKTAQGNTDANGIGDFYYAPPADYLALCTANLPETAIDPAKDDIPADYFNTVLYTGDGATTRTITGVGFQPDFTWIKRRNTTGNHTVFDAVRGATNWLSSNSTESEFSESYTDDAAFIADGFKPDNAGSTNASGSTYVGWNWKAGGSAVANTDGTIASQVSANTKAGFSIVTYTGDGTNGATIGHGLGAVPSMVITKARSNAGEWMGAHESIGVSNLILNQSLQVYNPATQFSQGGLAQLTSSSTFGIVSGSTGPDNSNKNGTDFVAYCFHGVEGFSKFGSYTGNGSTDGPFINTGFRPAYVMIRRTDVGNSWVIIDAVRDVDNYADKIIWADLSDAEATGAAPGTNIDLLSNGFKNTSTGGSINTSGGTYIYMAFAEMPFKYANAR